MTPPDNPCWEEWYGSYYNGEIYNYPELRESLCKEWKFVTKSDSECILAAYAKYKQDCLEHFRECFLLLFGIKSAKAFL